MSNDFNNVWNGQHSILNQPNQYGNTWTPQLKTNKILVTSLEEAIAKSNDRYSEYYYFDQSKPVFYIVRTDMNMAKSWIEIPYTIPNQENNTPVTKADLARLEERINDLENKSNTRKKKVEQEQEVNDNEST
jgi:hypothetical protein